MKKTVCFVSAFLLALSLRAEVKQFGDFTVSLKVDRSDGMYQQGEECSFTLLITGKGAPVPDVELDAAVSKDGVAPFVRSLVKTDAEGKAHFKGTLREPGFVRCTCLFKLPDGPGMKNIQAGAAYDPLLIKPSRPAPDDFVEYWQKQKDLLAAVPMNIVITPVESLDENVLLFDVQADSLIGKLSGYLSYPKNAQPGTLPAIVTCHGGGVRSSYGNRSGANSHSAWSAGKWAALGFIALDFNAFGLPNGQPREFYADLQKTTLDHYWLRGTESRDSLFFRDLYLRLMRAMDVVTAQPQWDGKILVVAGRSQGAGQAIAAAGLNSKVTFIVAHIPSMCDMTGMLIGRVNGWPNDLGAKHMTSQEKAGFLKSLEGRDTVGIDANGVDVQNKVQWDMSAIENTRYIDAVNFARLAKCGAFFSVGFCDKICSPTAGYAAYNNIPSANKEMFHGVDYGHYSDKEADAAAEAAVARHVQQMRAQQ